MYAYPPCCAVAHTERATGSRAPPNPIMNYHDGVTMNSGDLWILCGRHVELWAFLHLRQGATIPLCTSSIGHFTWTNWVQVQSRRLSDVVWWLFLNGVPVGLCPVVSPRKLLQFLLAAATSPSGRQNVFLGHFLSNKPPEKCSVERRIGVGNESRGLRFAV